MKVQEYMEESARTMSPIIHEGAFKVETLHGIIGVSTEAGELLDAVKKGLFYGHAPDMENIREEIGDILWYIAAIARAEGWDIEDIMQENIDKLRKRYPEQFTSELAKVRMDKA
jgi:NTP pyrophosphatase (non-canonical NTP hydrolase)